MKTILIATDFSNASRNASLYGWQLARAMKAKVILFTAYQVSHPIAAVNMQVSHFDVRMQTQKKLADEAEIITSHDASQIEIVCDEGVSQDMIVAIAVEKSADLIIVGMKGGGKNLRKVFGSTATSLLGASVPVIIVPAEAKYSAPKSIVYASDIFLDTDIEAVDQIQWITAFFGSKLHVVRVVSDDSEAVCEQVNVPNKLREGLKAVKTTFQFPVNANISNGLNDFIKEQHADLLVMRPHKHELLERIFIKSETKDMIFHSHVALLVLPHTSVEPVNSGALQTIENYSADN